MGQLKSPTKLTIGIKRRNYYEKRVKHEMKWNNWVSRGKVSFFSHFHFKCTKLKICVLERFSAHQKRVPVREGGGEWEREKGRKIESNDWTTKRSIIFAVYIRIMVLPRIGRHYFDHHKVECNYKHRPNIFALAQQTCFSSSLQMLQICVCFSN